MASATEQMKELVYRATDDLLTGPDWGANMTIIDIVNSRPDVAPKVLKALKKRLTHKKSQVGILAIALLEALVKNSHPIHPLVADSDFLDTFIKVIPKKIRDPQARTLFNRVNSSWDVHELERYDRTLILIAAWAKEFAGTRFRTFGEKYQKLVRKGVKFPEPTKDESAQVFTPAVNLNAKRAEAKKALAQPAAAPEMAYTDRDCAIAHTNCRVLIEMLNETSPGDDLKSNELIQELLANIKAGRQAGFTRIEQSPGQSALDQILRVNDEMSDALEYYTGLVNGTVERRKNQPPEPEPEIEPVQGSDDIDDSEQKHGKKKRKKKKKKVVLQALAPPPEEGENQDLGAMISQPKSRRRSRSRSKGGDSQESSPAIEPTTAPANNHASASASPFDLDVLFATPSGGSSRAHTNTATAQTAPTVNSSANDIFDLFAASAGDSNTNDNSTNIAATNNNTSSNNDDDLDDLFGALSTRTSDNTPAATSQQTSSAEIFDPFA